MFLLLSTSLHSDWLLDSASEANVDAARHLTEEERSPWEHKWIRSVEPICWRRVESNNNNNNAVLPQSNLVVKLEARAAISFAIDRNGGSCCSQSMCFCIHANWLLCLNKDNHHVTSTQIGMTPNHCINSCYMSHIRPSNCCSMAFARPSKLSPRISFTIT